MKIVITGGGTGGHLSVASSFLQECKKHNFECIFIGSLQGQDRMYFENESGFCQKYFLQTSGVVNQKGIDKLKSFWYQYRAFREALRILKKEKITFVFSVGGYSAAPASFGAIFLKIPLIIHEQNARIGRLNKLLRPYAKLFFSSYLKSSPNKFYPVRRAFFQKARIRKTIKNILFMGGSQGAKTINNFALSVAEGLKERGIIIYHQCGEIDFKRVCDQYQSMDLKVKCFRIFDDFLQDDLKEKFDVFLFAFIHEIPEIFYRCDFAVSRSGASSLWELCANGLPALFVPYPYAASNHQFFNAKFLEDQNLGFLCEEKDLYDEVLWNVLDLCQQRVEQMSENLQKYCQLDATAQILEIILKEC